MPDAKQRSELWTSRVWPGAPMVGGELVGYGGNWAADISMDAWRPLATAKREAIEAEAILVPARYKWSDYRSLEPPREVAASVLTPLER